MSFVFVVSREILAMHVAGLDVVAVVDVDVRADRQEVPRLADSSRRRGSLTVLPSASFSVMRGRLSASLDSMIVLRDRPVTSSSDSCIVTPSTMSPYFT